MSCGLEGTNCNGKFGRKGTFRKTHGTGKVHQSSHILDFHESNTSNNRLMSSNWQQKDRHEFNYDLSGVEDALPAFAERTRRASGPLKGLTADAQAELHPVFDLDMPPNPPLKVWVPSCFLRSHDHSPPYRHSFSMPQCLIPSRQWRIHARSVGVCFDAH